MGNRPVNFNDPTGNKACGDGEEWGCDTDKKQDPNINPHPNWSPTQKGGTGDNNKNNEGEENCKGLKCLHNGDDRGITLPTVTPTLTAPSSEKTPPTDTSNDRPNWGKVAAGVGIIVVVDLLVAVPLVIGLTALAPELEIAMILTESWSWPLIAGIVTANVYGWDSIVDGANGN